MRIRGAFWGIPNIRPVILANEACQTNAGSVVKLGGWLDCPLECNSISKTFFF
jgi:hypothetical protein